MNNEDPVLFLEITQGVVVLQVNRPEARNALNWAAQKRFAEIIKHISQDAHIRALIITGSGERAFVSGGDLKQLGENPDREAGKRLNKVMGEALEQMTKLPIPVIAAINGDSFGGGCEIITACDLRIAVEHTRLSFAQVLNGLTTGWGGTGRLVHLVGRHQALDLLLTGRLLSAVEANQIGLVHRLASSNGSLMIEAVQWAEELVSLPREALAALKQLIYAAGDLTAVDLNKKESELFMNLWGSSDHLEALAAFKEKRKPQFNQDV